jgi:DNA-binding GntR family transcriptional regulator
MAIKEIARTTTAGRAVDSLRRAILSGELRAGRSIRQEELAAQLGISRIPLREALRQLEAEGFVTSAPHRGVVVAALSLEELREICEIRVQLECHVLGLAVRAHDERSLGRAEMALAEAIAYGDDERWPLLNMQFHRALYAPAQRPLILTEIERYHNHTERYLRVHAALFQHRGVADREHKLLVEAVRARRTEHAQEILREHIMQIDMMVSEFMKEARGQS